MYTHQLKETLYFIFLNLPVRITLVSYNYVTQTTSHREREREKRREGGKEGRRERERERQREM